MIGYFSDVMFSNVFVSPVSQECRQPEGEAEFQITSNFNLKTRSENGNCFILCEIFGTLGGICVAKTLLIKHEKLETVFKVENTKQTT